MSDTAKDLILFDGLCNLCERTVLFIIKRDRRAHYQFSSLQSDAAKRVLDQHQYVTDPLASVLLLSEGQLHTKSRAALRIARNLDGAWPVFYYLFFWVPAFIADRIYDFVGNRRYKWFGMKEACWIPSHELQQRFIDD